MKSAALQRLAMLGVVCAGLHAGDVASQTVTTPGQEAAFAPHPAASSGTDAEIARLQLELRQLQGKEREFRSRWTALSKAAQAEAELPAGQGAHAGSSNAASLQAQARDAERQADDAADAARSIEARIAELERSARVEPHPAGPAAPGWAAADQSRGAVKAQAGNVAAIGHAPVADIPAPPHSYKHAQEAKDVEEKITGSPPSVSAIAVAPLPALAAGPPAAKAPAAVADEPVTTLADDSAKIDELVSGSAGVTAPGTGKVGETFSVYLNVSSDKLSALLASMKAQHPGYTSLQGKDIKLTPRMTATVSGDGFDILPEAAQVQVVSSTEPTTWEWQVTPTQSGSRTLNVLLTGSLVVEGVDTPRTFYLDDEHILVHVGFFGFLRQYWQWLASTVVIPVAGVLWAVLRKRVDERGVPKPSVFTSLKVRRRRRTLTLQ